MTSKDQFGLVLLFFAALNEMFICALNRLLSERKPRNPVGEAGDTSSELEP